MQVGVFDAETTIRNQGENAIGSSKADPFHPDNFMVAYGELALGKKHLEYRPDNSKKLPVPWFLSTPEEVLMIGTNVPFDLKWMWREWPNEFWAKLPTLKIWDIQQAHHLLSGQDEKYPSLNEISEYYGLPQKDDRIKTEYWDKGIDTTMVPKELLLEYLGSADLDNPLVIYHEQVAELMSMPNLYMLAQVKMEDKLMTTIMEINGMQFDLEFASEKADELDAEIEVLRERVRNEAQGFFVPDFEFDPDSSDHISLAVFGGAYRVVEDVPVRDEAGQMARYKGGQRKGQVKTRKEKVPYTTKGFGLAPGIAPKLKNGLWSSQEDFLLPHAEHSFVKDVLRLRELAKDSSTYFRGYAKFVFPDGRIHPNYNHEATETGRLSNSQPNLQNVTTAEE